MKHSDKSVTNKFSLKILKYIMNSLANRGRILLSLENSILMLYVLRFQKLSRNLESNRGQFVLIDNTCF